MIGTLLYVFGSCERHSELTEEMYIPLRPIQKEDSLRRWRFYKLAKWQKLTDQSTWFMEVTQQIYFVRKVLNPWKFFSQLKFSSEIFLGFFLFAFMSPGRTQGHNKSSPLNEMLHNYLQKFQGCPWHLQFFLTVLSQALSGPPTLHITWGF